MSHVLYVLIGSMVGAFVGVIGAFLYLSDCYAKQQQKEEILYLINGIKRLKKAGKIPVIRRAIRIFAHHCLHFNPEIFRSFGKKEFDNIASAIAFYENQNYQYSSSYGDAMGVPRSTAPLTITVITEEETRQKICENLERAFAL